MSLEGPFSDPARGTLLDQLLAQEAAAKESAGEEAGPKKRGRKPQSGLKYQAFVEQLQLGWLSKTDLQVLNHLDQVEAMVEELRHAPFVVFDTETTGLRVIDDKIVALQFCASPDRAFFIPIRMLDQQFTNLPIADVAVICRPLWEKGLVGHNIGYDWKMMRQYGIDLNIVADTLLETKLFDVNIRAGLKDVSQTLLGMSEVISFKSLFPATVRSDQRRFDTVPFKLAVPYACQDVLLCYRLHQHFQQSPEINPADFIYQLEHQLIKPMCEMERLGVRLDLEKIEAAKIEADRILAEQKAIIDAAAGEWEPNLDRPADVRQLLYVQLGLGATKQTATGLDSTDAATLKLLAGHPVVDAILTYKEVNKLKQAFLDALPGKVQSDGCIHTSYHQYGADSGRMSSSDPNLQQIPKERGLSADALRKAIRGSFLPPPGFAGFLDIDYSQIEYRLFASLSGEPGLMEAFAKNIDVHKQTAAIMLNLPLEQVDKNVRQKGKAINFMAIYGGSKYKLAEMIGVSVDEADALMKQYWSTLRRADAYVKSIRTSTKQMGYTQTYFGRRRKLPRIYSKDHKERSGAERQSVNTAVQGTASDLIKMAIVRLHNALLDKGFRSRLVLTVHDELVVAHHPSDDLDALAELARWAMEIDIPGWCAMISEPGYGADWNEINDFVYPSRREAGATPAPDINVPLPAIETPKPVEYHGASLTLHLADDATPLTVESIARLCRSHTGHLDFYLEAQGRRWHAGFGLAVNRALLLELRARGIRYTISEAAQKLLLKTMA